MKTDQAPQLKLEIRRLRSVDLDKISGGEGVFTACHTNSRCAYVAGSHANSSD